MHPPLRRPKTPYLSSEIEIVMAEKLNVIIEDINVVDVLQIENCYLPWLGASPAYQHSEVVTIHVCISRWYLTPRGSMLTARGSPSCILAALFIQSWILSSRMCERFTRTHSLHVVVDIIANHFWKDIYQLRKFDGYILDRCIGAEQRTAGYIQEYWPWHYRLWVDIII